MFYIHRDDDLRILAYLLKAWLIKHEWSQQEWADKALADREKINILCNGPGTILCNSPEINNTKNKSLKIFRTQLTKAIDCLINFKDLESRKNVALWLLDGTSYPHHGGHVTGGKSYEKGQKNLVIYYLNEARDIYEKEVEDRAEKGKAPLKEKEIKKGKNKGNNQCLWERPNHFSHFKILPYRKNKEEVGQELLNLERIKSIWLYMRQLPGFTSRCLDIDKNGKPIIKCNIGESDRLRAENFFCKIGGIPTNREKVLEDPVGVRVIHEENAIIKYLKAEDLGQNKTNYGSIKKERENNIRILIELLKEYEAFQLRIAPITTPFEFQINGLKHVLVRARLDVTEPPEELPNTENSIRYMSLIGEENLIPFLVEFERVWNQLEDDQPDNGAVIKKLETIL